jgi:hypothetical protein
MLFGLVGFVCWVLIVFGIVGVLSVGEDAIEEDAAKSLKKGLTEKEKKKK